MEQTVLEEFPPPSPSPVEAPRSRSPPTHGPGEAGVGGYLTGAMLQVRSPEPQDSPRVQDGEEWGRGDREGNPQHTHNS